MRTHFTGMPRVFLVELQHGKLERIHARHILVDALTLEGTVVQLVDDDGGKPNVPRRMPSRATCD